jgi:hypothetical protein
MAQSPCIPDAAMKQMSSLIGTWKCETRIGDKITHEDLVAKWGENKDAVIWEWKGKDIVTGQVGTSTGIIGWDGRQNVLFEAGVASTGETFIATHGLGSDRWESPTKGTRLIDGKFVRETSMRIFKWNSSDELSITSKNRKIKDRDEPDVVGILRRSK